MYLWVGTVPVVVLVTQSGILIPFWAIGVSYRGYVGQGLCRRTKPNDYGVRRPPNKPSVAYFVGLLKSNDNLLKKTFLLPAQNNLQPRTL